MNYLIGFWLYSEVYAMGMNAWATSRTLIVITKINIDGSDKTYLLLFYNRL